MNKAIEPEIALEFPIDARQQIQIECRRDALPIIVGCAQDANILVRSTPITAVPLGPTCRWTRRRNEMVSLWSRLPMVSLGRTPTCP